jgi:sugar lactone lactonase YvrE
VKNADIWTFAENSTADLEMPSGLAFHDEMIFVVDHATSIIWAFDLDGEVVDWLDTGVESDSLMGLDFDADGRLYVVDAASDKVLRISAL